MIILYAEDNEDIRELFIMKIEAAFDDIEVIECESGNQAISTLRDNRNIDIILTDYNMPDGNAPDLYQFWKESNLSIPFIVVTGNDELPAPIFKTFKDDHPGNTIVEKPPLEGVLKKAIDNALSAQQEVTEEIEDLIIEEVSEMSNADKYSPVKIKTLLKHNTSPVNVYIKMSDEKYLKVVNENDPYETDRINKYAEKGVTHLYIEIENVDKFTNYCISSIVTELNFDETRSTENTSSVQVEAQELVQKQLNKIGINETVIQVLKTSVETSIKVMESEPKLSKLFKKMANSGKYLYEHSLFLSYLSSGILRKTDWKSKDTLIKMNLASMTHDITLTDEDLAKKLDLDRQEIDNLTKSSLEKYKNHVSDASALVNSMRSFPPDINVIVHQHHEMPDGSGFPRGLKATTIAPLAAVFITAHTFLEHLYNSDFTEEAQIKALEEMDKIFNKANFRKPYESLKKMFP